MSKLEDSICNHLHSNFIKYETQISIPIDNCPWKNGRNITSKCDIYLPESKLYIEIKGFMTIFAMAKMSWFCKQNICYYIFQGTENDWPIKENDAILNEYNSDLYRNNKSKLLKYNIEYQIKELLMIEKNKFKYINDVSLQRLKGFIKNRINEYIIYNGEWY
jgi:hypothetical protein